MLLNMFRALMPREDQIVAAFSAHAAKGVEAAILFRALVAEPDRAEERQQELRRVEHEADEISRALVRKVQRSFVTPFDRSEILALADALDDVIDLMKDAGRRTLHYRFPSTEMMVAMADRIVTACEEIRDMVPLLAAVPKNAEAIMASCRRIDAIESEADRFLADGLQQLFSGDGSPGTKLTGERVYDLIEAVIDRCEDVAKLVEGIVTEQV